MIDKRPVVMHGLKAHRLGVPCEVCDKMMKQFDEDLKSERVKEMIAPKNTMMRKIKTKKVR